MAKSKKQKVEEVKDIVDRDSVARTVSDLWTSWKNSRSQWEDEKREIRQYLFATDTTDTTNAKLPWTNKTTIPKLTQIRDNLHANYIANLFPRRKWLQWENQESDDKSEEKRRAIEAFMQTKVEDSDFQEVMDQLVLDFVDYGNAFAEVIFEENTKTLPSGVEIPQYTGPRVVRISPMDIVFDVTASRFEDAPNIVRSIKTIGQLHRDLKNMAATDDERKEIEAIIEHVKKTRAHLSEHTDAIVQEGLDFHVDGFATVSDYFRSGYVEVLTYEGDLWDQERMELHENQIITVVDRAHLAMRRSNVSWIGQTNKTHVGWRLRPDNLMAMGPLDNLVGMQYRIDHMENVKADVWDLIAYPPLLVKGEVEAFDWAPLEQIHVEDNADVAPLAPETQAINADTMILQYETQMEQLAGAPRQALGIRTPGEKTAFEVEQLQNAAQRTFENKINNFEVRFVEPILNKMLEAARRNMNSSQIIREFDDDFGVTNFLEVSATDLTATGKLRPLGARHFSENSQIAANLERLYASGIMSDPAVATHLSGKTTARIIEDVLNLDQFDLARDNVRIAEQLETQQFTNSGRAQLQEEQAAEETLIRGEEQQ